MKTIVVIPVYKNPDEDELISLSRCCEVLFRNKMVLVCPADFDTSSFQYLWAEYGLTLDTERFDNNYFKSISGYNRLLLSECFYSRFADYDYMLIYQTDAYVFDDKLEKWCAKGFDYVGAPIVGRYDDTEFHPDVMRVGNGGFSLRKVKTYLNYFSGRKNVVQLNQIAERINLKKKVYTRWFVWLLMALGWHNRPKSFAGHWRYNEDDFWSGALTNTNYELSKPAPEEAVLFAFERFPKELYEMTGELPFGCHAWRKYEYDSFWRGYIH